MDGSRSTVRFASRAFSHRDHKTARRTHGHTVRNRGAARVQHKTHAAVRYCFSLFLLCYAVVRLPAPPLPCCHSRHRSKPRSRSPPRPRAAYSRGRAAASGTQAQEKRVRQSSQAGEAQEGAPAKQKAQHKGGSQGEKRKQKMAKDAFVTGK